MAAAGFDFVPMRRIIAVAVAVAAVAVVCFFSSLRKGNTRWIGEILIMSPAIRPAGRPAVHPSVGFVTDMAPPPPALRAGGHRTRERTASAAYVIDLVLSEVFLEKFPYPNFYL